MANLTPTTTADDRVVKVDVAPRQPFQHQCLDEQNAHIKNVTAHIVSWVTEQKSLIQNASNSSMRNIQNTILMTGPMAAGKSSVLALAVEQLRSSGNDKVFSFGLKDDRDPDPEQIYNRNNKRVKSELIDRRNSDITLITNKILIGDITQGSVIFISEAQFLSDNPAQLDALIEIARSSGILIVFDCLDKYYNGKDIPMTAHLKSIIGTDRTHQMFACDTFTQGRAQNTLRFVRLGFDGGFIAGSYDETDPRYNDGGKYLDGLTGDARQIIVNKILCDPGLTQFVKGDHVLVPSHATEDSAYVPGEVIYAPGNIRFIQEAFSYISNLREVLNSYNTQEEC